VGSENSARAMVRAGAVDLLAAVSSVVVVHELAHAVARVDDITYFYDDMIQLSRDDALNNAQSYGEFYRIHKQEMKLKFCSLLCCIAHITAIRPCLGTSILLYFVLVKAS